MTYLVDGKEQVLICCCTDKIGCQEEAEREERCETKTDSEEELDGDDSKSEVFCQRLVATEFGYLLVSVQSTEQSTSGCALCIN